MKISIVLCSLTLALCMFAAGQYQSPSAQHKPSVGTPPTFPQQQQPDTSTTYPPDTAPKGSPTNTGSPASGRSSGVERTEIQGCLTQSGNGFVLTSQAGILYQLQGENAELARHVGEQVSLSGLASTVPGSSSSTASTPADTENSGSAAEQNRPAPLNTFTVSSVKKVGDTCTGARH
jgi:hypothetical protein